MDDKGRGSSFFRRPRKPTEKIDRPKTPRKKPEPAEPVAQAPETPPQREERIRVVVPRQERGRGESQVDVELRELRWGKTSRGAYLRVVPSKQRFKRSGAGRITATLAGSQPVTPIERVMQAIKGVVLGNRFASSQIVHERLNKVKALAIFSSDALSSSAYATEEILIIMALAGTGAFHYSLPIALIIATLIVIVTVSYRQTIKAYPGGGGAYIVALENLGRTAGLVAGSALLVDYVLTVSVSTAAGVAAVTSAVPDLIDLRVPIGVAVICLITLGNLRGIREAGSIFAIPTYFFVFSMSAVIVLGFVKLALGDAPGSFTESADPVVSEEAQQGVTLFLLMRAFSSGSAALTGIEAISNGVPAFEKPEVKNAQTTMAFMAGILAFLFLGITFLTSRYGLVPGELLEGHHETIVSQLGRAVLGKNVLYYALQVGTALVLFLAANTSYSAFPPLGANLAKDHFLPRQFSFRGDRLAYSNGILILSAAAIALLIAFQADVNKLIPLYALGVFISFTLSQVGMVIHIRRVKEVGWRWGLAVSAFGGLATFIVAIIIGLSKFTSGAYMAIIMMAVMMVVFALIRRHYDWYYRIIAVPEEDLPSGVQTAVPLTPGSAKEHVIVPVDGINKISMGAINMARAVSGNIHAVHLVDDLEEGERFHDDWVRHVPDVPLLIIESPYRAFAAPMLAFIEQLKESEPDRRITVIIPEFKAHHWWESILHNRAIAGLRPFLEEEDIRVVEFVYDVPRSGPDEPR